MKNAVSCPTESILEEIGRQITWAKDVYNETGDAFHLGEISALDSLRNFILFVSTEKEKPETISLVDASEPDDAVLDRIMMKVGAVGEAMRNINSMAAALVC